MDEEITWYSGNVAGATHLLFRMPAWPYPLWPKAVNSEYLYASITDQVPEPVKKSMNSCHSVFDPSSEDAESAAVEARKWRHVLLDFSKVRGIGELSSKVLFSDAGEKEALDYDLIEVPLHFDNDGNALSYQTLLGFKVGCVDPNSSRKVARTGAIKSKLQQKREAAQRARKTTQQMNQG